MKIMSWKLSLWVEKTPDNDIFDHVEDPNNKEVDKEVCRKLKQLDSPNEKVAMPKWPSLEKSRIEKEKSKNSEPWVVENNVWNKNKGLVVSNPQIKIPPQFSQSLKKI